jgi:hypothetical protein
VESAAINQKTNAQLRAIFDGYCVRELTAHFFNTVKRDRARDKYGMHTSV